MWGLDIVGPLPTAPGGRKFFLATTDYFTNISTIKWASRSIKQSRLGWTKEKARKGKRQVGRRTSSCFMGIPHHTSAINGRNTILLSLRNGSSNPTRSWPPHNSKRKF
ncbi:hypothetical protein CsSME_00001131 [Camellia sinensis var. sinensis]